MLKPDVASTIAHMMQAVVESSVNGGGDDLEDAASELAHRLRGNTVVRSYEDVGMLTSDSGFVIVLDDGREIAVTVTRRR